MTLPIAPDDPAFDPADFDFAVDPGTDFYRFVNGGWMDRNPVPPEYPRWAAFEEVNTRNETLLHALLEEAAASPGKPGDPAYLVGRYYSDGMDTQRIADDGLEPIRPLLERIEAIQGLDDFLAMLPELHMIGAGPLFAVTVIQDFDDATRHLLSVGQSGLGLPERDYYLRDDDGSRTLRSQYSDHLARMLELVGHADPGGAAAAVLQLETELAEPSYTNTQLRNMDLVINRTLVSDLVDRAPALRLGPYLEDVGAALARETNVDNPGYFEALEVIVGGADPATLRAYATSHLLRAAASGLSPEIEDEQFRFYGTVLGGQQVQKPRWKRVLRAATSEIGQLVARLYVETAFGEDAKERALEMVGHLLSAMEQSIRDLDWMTDETKQAALAKLAGFTPKIGFPDEWKDYSELSFGDGPWIEHRFAARRFEHRRTLRKLSEPVDPHEWGMAPHEVNAYYHPLRNEIVFPAGILQPPFFDADADDAVNFGGIGAVIGHEITHGFDDMGSRFDAHGHFRNWWSEPDRTEFERRAKVVADQYSAFAVFDDLSLNGELTLGENIADLGGVTIAYSALQEALRQKGRTMVGGLTPEQRFFLAYARVWRTNQTDEFLRLQVTTDPHSPAEFRCNAVLSNFAPFAEAFELPEGVPMVRAPEERAEVW